MDRKNLLIVGSLTGIIIVLLGVWLFISLNSASVDSTTVKGNAIFNAKTPEEKAIFIARLNVGTLGFNYIEGTNNYTIIVDNASLTPDGKYWRVNMHQELKKEIEGDKSYYWTVIIDAKTLMSEDNRGFEESEGIWKSLDELAAEYIAQLQAGQEGGYISGRPYKITMDGKEVWKVPIHYRHEYDPEKDWYIYVDVATGKSKNEGIEFNKAAGTNGWLTLKEVDNVINKMGYYYGPISYNDGLRELYPE